MVLHLLCVAARVQCRAGHGMYNVIFCFKSRHCCKAAFQPVDFDIYLFLVWLLKKQSIVLWTVQNFFTRRKKTNITTKRNRQTKGFTIFLSLRFCPTTVKVERGTEKCFVYFNLMCQRDAIFFQLVLDKNFFFLLWKENSKTLKNISPFGKVPIKSLYQYN